MVIRIEKWADQEYIKYMNDHIANTQKAFQEVKPYLVDVLEPQEIQKLEAQITAHDKSKYSEEEWSAYRNKFYPTQEEPADDAAFDLAWLHHQHHNPHHWQHWLLLRDSGELVALDMPLCYVIEMLCDWASFSVKNPESTAYKWWQDNRSKMKMSESTVALVEEYIQYFKEPVKGGDSNE